MPFEVKKIPFELDSVDGMSMIRGFCWMPCGLEEPRGLVQLLHGMAEYIDRYDDFARFLAAQGFLVFGHDHIGHGQSQPDADRRGKLPVEGADIMVANAQLVQDSFAENFPYAPVFVFGHSMGSFIARALLCGNGEHLAGAIICGTGFVPVATSRAGNLLARAICRVKGEDVYSPLLHSLADGAYSKAIPDARTPFDWLNTDDVQVDAYIEDSACGYGFSAGGYASLTALTAEVCSSRVASGMPAYVPQLFIAGAQDPVGNNGVGVRQAAQLSLDAGATDVQVKLYPDMRHEILNEPGHAQVYADVLQWLTNVAS